MQGQRGPPAENNIGMGQNVRLPSTAPSLVSRFLFQVMLLDNAYAVLAMGGPPAGASPEEQKKAMVMQVGMMVFFVLIFYVLMIRPQQKKAKEQQELIKALKTGDKVLTSAGLVAVVVGIKDNTVTIRSGESKLEITKSAITEVTERASA